MWGEMNVGWNDFGVKWTHTEYITFIFKNATWRMQQKNEFDL